MSNIIHMETEQTHNLASALQRVSQTFVEQSRFLRQQALTTDWSGPSRDQIVGEAGNTLLKINTLAEDGETLCLRVQREVDEWLGADASFGGGAALVFGAKAATQRFSPIQPASWGGETDVRKISPHAYAQFSKLAYFLFVMQNPKSPSVAEQKFVTGYGCRPQHLKQLGNNLN